ncbi:AraC family transcriptional regulator [Flavobacterium psychrophilum]|nr:AraC family transcriptional regulator [Flavobacterium psychrophilum]AOE53723.1 AraC family transcriptional regulator [Flavobacterium psychrophilum]
MKKEENKYHRFESLSDAHRALGLPKPLHPLMSIIDNRNNTVDLSKMPESHVLSFYKISYEGKMDGKLKYGQGYYDFDEGGLLFAAPNQLISSSGQDRKHSGYGIFIHPDFFLGYPLAKKIKQYGFFSYSANEALHLSEKEKETVLAIFKFIEDELSSRIDDLSQDVIISQIELLLTYSERFYKRQFITRKAVNNDLLGKLENLLDDYFANEKTVEQGLPSVQYLSEQLNISPSYLSDMLRSLTGQNAQQHIHNKLIEKAKEQLSSTNLTVSEVAYTLGFEHSQSFSKFFKTKTNLTPVQFRQSFN